MQTIELAAGLPFGPKYSFQLPEMDKLSRRIINEILTVEKLSSAVYLQMRPENVSLEISTERDGVGARKVEQIRSLYGNTRRICQQRRRDRLKSETER